jgi:hypothetical protein
VSDTGWAAIPNWLLRDPDLSPYAKLLYVYLSSRADAHGVSYPSQGTIATETGMSVSTVKRCSKELIDRRILVVWPVSTAVGRRNNYRLVIDRLPMGGQVTQSRRVRSERAKN